MLVGEIINLQPDLTSNLSQGTNSMQNMATLAVLVRFTRVGKVALEEGVVTFTRVGELYLFEEFGRLLMYGA